MANIKDLLKLDLFKTDREYHQKLRFQVTGESENQNVQIIAGFESKTIKDIREKYGIPINWLWEWILKPVHKIFNANGGGIFLEVKGISKTNEAKEEILKNLNSLKNGYSLRGWMQKVWLKNYIIDPAGVVLIEHDGQKAFPVFYSISEIKYYALNGRDIEEIIFNPVSILVDGKNASGVRVYNAEGDQMYQQNEADLIKIDSYKDPVTFTEKKGFYPIPKNWGTVPAFIIGDIPDTEKNRNKSKIRLSTIDNQLRLGEQYFALDTIKTFVAIKNGYGTYYWYSRICKTCKGEGWLDQQHTKKCNTCGGAGRIYPKNVNDIYLIDINPDSSEKLPEKPGGIIEGDTKGWETYLKQLDQLGRNIELSKWGTHRSAAGADNNTATGAFIDINTANDLLDSYSQSAEYAETKILNYIGKYVNQSFVSGRAKYGRRYNVESPDTIYSKYLKAIETGSPESVKNELLIEYYESAYKTDPETFSRMKRLMQLEPFLHYTVIEVISWESVPEKIKLRKQFFSAWSSLLQNSDLNSKTNDQLSRDLDIFINNQNK